MRFKILGNRLVIRPRKPVFSSILARPEIAREDYSEDGEILQVGEGVQFDLEVGMHVAYHPGVGERMNFNEEEVLIVNGGDVRALIDPEQEVPDGLTG